MERAVDRELQESIRRVDLQKKKQAKKEREANAKADYRKKMSVIAGAAIENDEDLTLDKKTWERVREIGIEDVYKHIEEMPEEQEMDDQERKYKFLTDGGTKLVDDDSDLSDDERKVKRMEDELAEQIRSNKEYKQLKTKRE